MQLAGLHFIGPLDNLITYSKILEPVAIAQHFVASVTSLNTSGKLLKPPSVRIATKDGRHFDLGILAGPRKRNGSSENYVALLNFQMTLGAAGYQLI
jgi:hypothetical protein